MNAATVVNEEPVDRIMTVSKLKQLLDQFPSDMLVFIKNNAGDYSTAITLNITEDDLELNVYEYKRHTIGE